MVADDQRLQELEFIMQLLWDDQTAKTEERQMGSSSIPRSEVVEENIVVLMGRTKGKLDIEENFQIEPAYRGRGIGTWALRRLLCHESIRVRRHALLCSTRRS